MSDIPSTSSNISLSSQEGHCLLGEVKGELATLKQMFENFTRGIDESRLKRALPGAFEEPDQVHETANLVSTETSPRFQDPETTNYDGKLIWKIQDFRRRRDDAKRGSAMSMYSPPFYTSRYGYKMCLRIYLNGDGMGRNTHISLFFVLMKGEYDTFLPFPFKQEVTLSLLDQGPNCRHLVDSFRPDPSSSSFKRPTSDMNIASGCPKFVAHANLGDSAYVVDDAMLIRAVINLDGLENF